MMMLRISLLALINVRMPNSLLFYIICSSGLRLACKVFLCVYLPIWMRFDLKRLCALCMSDLFILIFSKFIFKRLWFGNLYICLFFKNNTFNSIKEKLLSVLIWFWFTYLYFWVDFFFIFYNLYLKDYGFAILIFSCSIKIVYLFIFFYFFKY